jgi:hypothetical protein
MLKETERRAFDARFAALWMINMASVIEKSDRHAASIMDVKKGGVLRISGEAFVVTGVATYTETNKQYTKDEDYVSTEFTLFSLKTGATRYLEWSKDDVLEVSLTERKLKKAELEQSLTDEDGESFDFSDLKQIVDDEEDLAFDNNFYSYDDDWPARFVSDDGRTANLHIYEFSDPTESVWLTIEAWEDTGGTKDFEVFISSDIISSDVEVISLG